MNEELRRSLDRAAGEDPQIDLVESAWTGGRVLRRRRHVTQAVGGVGAAVVLAGAFAIGGGVLNQPDAYVGPALPTQDDTVVTTSPVDVPPVGTGEPTTEEPATDEPATEDPVDEPTTEPPVGEPTTAEPTTEEPPPSGPVVDGVLTLTPDSIEGLPLDSPTPDLLAAITAELGEPVWSAPGGATDCSLTVEADIYGWDQFHLTAQDVGLTWIAYQGEPVTLDLPGLLELGTSEADVRAGQTVVDEYMTGGGWPVLVLDSGLALTLGDGNVVVSVASSYTPTC
jgi:hypothetical protein